MSKGPQQIIAEALQHMKPDQVLEYGLSITARGLYRKAVQDGPDEALKSAFALSAAIRHTAIEITKQVRQR